MRRAAKRDDNEALIVRALGSAGWTVVRVSDTGVPDLLCAKSGVLTPLEVKSGDGELTPAQRETFGKLRAAGVLVQVVRSPNEALRAVHADQHVAAGVYRWLGVNGAFLCESCWLPENGLHAKDCPTRQALKVPGKVRSAYRAAKEAQDVLPKKACVVCPNPVNDAGYACAEHDPAGPSPAQRSRGVEGELQPIKKVRVRRESTMGMVGHPPDVHRVTEEDITEDEAVRRGVIARPPPSD